MSNFALRVPGEDRARVTRSRITGVPPEIPRMAVTARDEHGTLTKRRKADGPQLDRRSAPYFAIVNGTESRGFPTRQSCWRVSVSWLRWVMPSLAKAA